MTIADAALKVHRALGSGLLESDYQACPAHDLQRIKRQDQAADRVACLFLACLALLAFRSSGRGRGSLHKVDACEGAALLGQHLRSGR